MKKILCTLLGILLALPSWSADLPAGYTELEYIQSDGTNWIETDYRGTEKTGAYLKYSYPVLSDDTSGRVFGYRISASNQWVAYIGTNAGTTVATTTYYMQSGAMRTSPTNLPNLDTNIHEVRINTDGSGDILFDSNVIGNSLGATAFTASQTMRLFSAYNNQTYSNATARIYSAQIYENGVLQKNFVPVRNGDDIGMFETVEGKFYQKVGTNNFTAGPDVAQSCLNILAPSGVVPGGFINASGVFTTDTSSNYYVSGSVTPGQVYTWSGISGSAAEYNNKRVHGYLNGVWKQQIDVQQVYPNQPYTITFTVPEGIDSIRLSYWKSDTNVQLEPGRYASAYCVARPIKIATTAYNSARFSPVVTELNDTIATIRDVVTNTINQTKAIADLQATKQTRPDENCPAGKKCLLVEDNDGTPHWYEIIESAD